MPGLRVSQLVDMHMRRQSFDRFTPTRCQPVQSHTARVIGICGKTLAAQFGRVRLYLVCRNPHNPRYRYGAEQF